MKQSPLKLLFNCLVSVMIVTMAFTINACSKKDDFRPIVDSGKGNIRFAIQIVSSEKESPLLLGSTRSLTGNGAIAVSPPSSRIDFTTKFVQGDSIGIFAVAAGQPLAASGNLIHNIKLTYDGTTWQSDAEWTAGVASYDFYAYYPFDSGMTNPINYRFEVAQDQRDFSTFSSSDLMAAKQTSVANNSVVSLHFQHLLSLVQIEVPATSSAGSIPDGKLEILLNRLQYAGAFNLFSQQFSTSVGASAGIRPYRVEKTDASNYKNTFTYRALVPSQTIPADHPLIFITQGSATKVTKQTTPLQMSPSSVYRFTFDDVPTGVSTAFIKAGAFLMGNPDPLAPSNERPLHWVRLTKDFYMSKHEVTIQQYADFLNAYAIKDQSSPTLNNDLLFTKNSNNTPQYDTGLKKWVANSGYGNYPMSTITYWGAVAYCNWVGGKLPTEAQWEYACRAGTSTPYFFGSTSANLGDYGWIYSNTTGLPLAGGQKLPNPFGLYDMYGNVAEITLDKFEVQDGSYPVAATEDKALVDPLGLSGNYYVARGAGVSMRSETSYSRKLYSLDTRNVAIGFRVVFED